MIALFFDTETTGFPGPSFVPEVVQIGAILQDTETKRILGELNLIVKPLGEIPQACIDIHGISNELARQCGVLPQIADKTFAALALSADIVVAHNYKFDSKVIEGVWPISHETLSSKQHYCTMMEGAKIDIPKRHAGNSKWPKLSDAYIYFFGHEFANAHDAMADVRACRDVYFKLIKEVPLEIPN